METADTRKRRREDLLSRRTYRHPAIIESWQDLDPATRDFAIGMSTGNDKERRLLDLGEQRIRAMDEAGIDVLLGSMPFENHGSREGPL